MSRVDRLTLTAFRNIEFLRLSPEAHLIAVTGPNGAGKTNLLEAISLLGPGRGLRRAAFNDLQSTMSSQTPWGIAATINSSHGEAHIGMSAEDTQRGTGSPASRKRRIVLNGKPIARQAELGVYMATLWLTPQMDGLFLQGASERRRFLDRMTNGLVPAHATRLSQYEKAVRERNRLLQMPNYEPAWLDGIEQQIATFGVAVASARRDLVLSLEDYLRNSQGSFPQASLSLKGDLDAQLDHLSETDAEMAFSASLRSLRQRDSAAGTTTIGAHRTDLEALHLGRGLPAKSCSTGEQKAVLLAIMLAAVRLTSERRGIPPVLLLDEASAHLDMERQGALCDELLNAGCQCWMTGTDAARFADLSCTMTHYRMDAGDVIDAA